MNSTNNFRKLGAVDLTFVKRGESRHTFAPIRMVNPPVNAGSHDLRTGIVESLAIAAQKNVAGAVIYGAGGTFMAGSDLKEFGRLLNDPQLPAVISSIENASFPVVAAIQGVALGGGFELALGCDYRFADGGAKVGLPEVSLGMIPGAGGTQRVPRLAGLPNALDLICSAKSVSSGKALELGLVDNIDEDPIEAGLAAVVSGIPKRLAMDLAVPQPDRERLAGAKQAALRNLKRLPNIAEAIRLVELSQSKDGRAVLTEERKVFQALRVGNDAFALRHLFFAERKAGKTEGVASTGVSGLEKVAVIGAGTMGRGIALALLTSDLQVYLVDQSADVLTKAKTIIEEKLAQAVDKGRVSESKGIEFASNFKTATSLDAACDCQLVIEAVFEDMALKKKVLGELEAALSDTAILATNTSYLDVDDLAASLDDPTRLVGMHFFSPADVMPLLEVVRGKKTSDTALATSMSLGRKMGKKPVVSGVAEGFIGNRIYAAYRRVAELLVLDGASPEQVDRAMVDFGFAMGPFAVSDLSGLDIAWARRKRLESRRDPQERYCAVPDRLCEAGRLGRKTGAGWYLYTDGKQSLDPWVDDVLDRERKVLGLSPRTFSQAGIQELLLAAIVNEAAQVLEHGTAIRASDIDVVLANGYGFPRRLGGPIYWASKLPQNKITAMQTALKTVAGHGFVNADVLDFLGSEEVTSWRKA